MSSAEPRRRRGTTSQTRDRSDYRRAAVDGEGPRRERTNVLDGKEGRTGRPVEPWGSKSATMALRLVALTTAQERRLYLCSTKSHIILVGYLFQTGYVSYLSRKLADELYPTPVSCTGYLSSFLFSLI
jgi:hypothetical protein